MTLQEAEAILKAVYEEYKDGWEKTRFISYVQATSAGAKLKKPQDLVRFTWDIEQVEEQIPQEEIEQRKQYLLSLMEKV